jgi:pilus assembly protein Flp/PilA
MLKKLLLQEEGQGLTEYALIIALIAIAVVAVMITFREQIKSTFSGITGALQSTT